MCVVGHAAKSEKAVRVLQHVLYSRQKLQLALWTEGFHATLGMIDNLYIKRRVLCDRQGMRNI